MNWRFIISGLFLLACGSFIDNSRGVLLPLITQQFQLSYTQSSGFFISGSIGSVVATFLLLILTRSFSEKRLVMAALILGITGLVLGNRVSSFWSLTGYGAFLGFILSSYGALSNLLVIHGTDLKSRSKMMCALHMIYGMTSILSPLICHFFLSHDISWSGCLALVAFLLIGLGLFVNRNISDEPPPREGTKPSLRLDRLQKWVVFIFCLYITGEVLNSMWFVTYLVKTQNMSVGLSSRYLSAFFVVMTLTRGLCFFSLEEEQESRLLMACLVGSMGFMVLGHLGWVWAFPLSGVLGPFFPLFLGRVSRVFHLQSKVLTLWILGMGYLTLGLFHLGVGHLAAALGMERAYWLPAIFVFLSFLAYWIYLIKERAYLRGLH